MKKVNLALIFSMLVMSLESCRLIGDIFKAGVWVGMVVVVLVVVLIVFIISRVFGS